VKRREPIDRCCRKEEGQSSYEEPAQRIFVENIPETVLDPLPAAGSSGCVLYSFSLGFLVGTLLKLVYAFVCLVFIVKDLIGLLV
jgi:hypothetical protein